VRRKTHEEYQEQLLNTEYVAIDIYQGADKHILHRHILCGHEWFIAPSKILQGRGCPECFKNNKKKTHKKYEEELLNTECAVLQPYVNCYTKILHKHLICGYEWLVRPQDILAGKGCPECATYGPTKANIVYLLYFPEIDLYKYGISNNVVRRSQELGHKAEILKTEKFDSHEEAKAREIYLLSTVALVNTGLLKSGNTETFKWS